MDDILHLHVQFSSPYQLFVGSNILPPPALMALDLWFSLNAFYQQWLGKNALHWTECVSSLLTIFISTPSTQNHYGREWLCICWLLVTFSRHYRITMHFRANDLTICVGKMPFMFCLRFINTLKIFFTSKRIIILPLWSSALHISNYIT